MLLIMLFIKLPIMLLIKLLINMHTPDVVLFFRFLIKSVKKLISDRRFSGTVD